MWDRDRKTTNGDKIRKPGITFFSCLLTFTPSCVLWLPWPRGISCHRPHRIKSQRPRQAGREAGPRLSNTNSPVCWMWAWVHCGLRRPAQEPAGCRPTSSPASACPLVDGRGKARESAWGSLTGLGCDSLRAGLPQPCSQALSVNFLENQGSAWHALKSP